jgi:hypothetical protein
VKVENPPLSGGAGLLLGVRGGGGAKGAPIEGAGGRGPRVLGSLLSPDLGRVRRSLWAGRGAGGGQSSNTGGQKRRQLRCRSVAAPPEVVKSFHEHGLRDGNAAFPSRINGYARTPAIGLLLLRVEHPYENSGDVVRSAARIRSADQVVQQLTDREILTQDTRDLRIIQHARQPIGGEEEEVAG